MTTTEVHIKVRPNGKIDVYLPSELHPGKTYRSATLSPELRHLAGAYLNSTQLAEVERQTGRRSPV